MRRNTGAVSVVPGVIVIALLIGAFAAFVPRAPVDPEQYAELARGLQVDVPALGPEESWRDGPPRDRAGPAWMQALIVAAAAAGELVLALVRAVLELVSSWVGGVLLAAVILSGLAYLLWKYGRVAGPGLGRAPETSHGAGAVAAPPPEGPGLDLEAVRAMRDPSRALGALVSLALTAAARMAGIRLGRSDTARSALRRLPADFEFAGALRALVAEAERVRFAGATITWTRVEALIETVRAPIERAAALEAEAS